MPDASVQQIRAWQDSIPPLQSEVREVLQAYAGASNYSAILEYVMPLESRRPDCIFLVGGAVIVLELKGKQAATQADLDQVAAYARDLRCYHRHCDAPTHVHAVLVPTRMRGFGGQRQNVHICGPDALDDLVRRLELRDRPPIPRPQFLDEDAYRPLPNLVAAARELLEKGSLRRIHRAASCTEPAVKRIRDIAMEAARTRTRRLVLLTGVPGAGKTLVGLQTVHAHWLDDLAVARKGEKPSVPAVFLSGNGPLVEVLQYELRGAGGGGKTFVRGVKDYVTRHSSNRAPIPQEHVIVFDEAQRAYDRAMVAAKHKIPESDARSEPEIFIDLADRIPEWCVIVGLIGGGQEIHKGEEAGIVQWRDAIRRSNNSANWHIHCPSGVAEAMRGTTHEPAQHPELSLDTELRFHLTKDVHRFVAGVLEGEPAPENRKLADQLEASDYHLRITREIDDAKNYLRERYSGEPDKRFGLLASSRDKELGRFRIANDYQATKQVRFGPWYGQDEHDPDGRSCRRLLDCVTEFGAQGLELDAALVAWGTDFRMRSGRWNSSDARQFKKDGVEVKDPHQLRVNSYRVLLTRGREGAVIFVPPIASMDETYEYLTASGIRVLR